MQRNRSGVPETPVRAFCGCVRVVARATALFVALAPSLGWAQDPAAFSEDLVVGETGLLVDAARALSSSELDALTAADVVVVVDDVERRVTRIEAATSGLTAGAAEREAETDACRWRFVVYVDTILGSPRTVTTAALTVGQHTELLTQMGCVDVMLADPAPRTVLASSRAPRHVEKVLVDIAERARRFRDADPLALDTPAPVRDHRDRRTIRAQWDRLINHIAGRENEGPRVLLLIADGFRLSPDDLETLAGQGFSAEGPASSNGLADIVMDTAQALSSYGWITFALPMTDDSRPKAEPGVDELERFREMSEGRILAGEKRWVVNFFGSTRRDRATTALDDRLYEAYVLPHLAPLRALAEATAGGLAWREQQFEELLGELGRTRLVSFESTEPHDGRVRRLQVRLAEEQTFLRAPWWKRSSTPDLVAESRLRRLLAGETLPGRLVVVGELLPSSLPEEAGRNATQLKLRVAPMGSLRGESIGHVRVSVALLDAAGIVTFEHSIDYDAPALGGDWQYALPVRVPAGTRGLAVGVEDLSLEEWGAAIVQLSGQKEGS